MTRANRVPSRAGVANDVSKYQLAVDVDAIAQHRIRRGQEANHTISAVDDGRQRAGLDRHGASARL